MRGQEIGLALDNNNVQKQFSFLQFQGTPNFARKRGKGQKNKLFSKKNREKCLGQAFAKSR